MSRGPWIFVLGLACLLRVAGACWWQARLPDERLFLFGDSESYWHLATSLAAGEPFQFGGPQAKIFRTPGYPLVLAPVIYFLGPGRQAVLASRLVGAVLGVASVALTMWWAQQLFGARVAWWAGLLVACYPGAIMLSVMVLSEAAFCPAMLAQLGCWTRSARHTSAWSSGGWAILAGLAGGCAVLCRPSWLLFLPFAGLLSLAGSARRQRLRECGLGLAALIVVMAPWWWRNYQVVQRFVPTTLQVGASLYDGLSPRATGASQMDFVPKFEDQLRRERGSADAPADVPWEVELDRRMKQASLDWARQNPSRVLELVAIKFGRIWNVWPNDAQFRAWPLRLAVTLTYVPLLVGALAGAWVWRRCGWPLPLCYLPAIYLTLLHVIFVGSMRYREPAMFGFAILAAAWLADFTGAARDAGDLRRTESSVGRREDPSGGEAQRP